MYTPSKNLSEDLSSIQKIPVIDKLLKILCQSTAMRFCVVSRMTETRWLICAIRDELNFGLSTGDMLEVEDTMCNEVMKNMKEITIDDVAQHPFYCNHYLPRQNNFKSFISVPIFTSSGNFFGTICSMDPEPAHVSNPETLRLFKHFARLIAFYLDTQGEFTVKENQIAAVLDYNIRNPVTNISKISNILLTASEDKLMHNIAKSLISSASHISIALDNTLIFSKTGSGRSIVLHEEWIKDISVPLKSVMEKLQIMWPNTLIQPEFTIDAPVYADRDLIMQLFTNLLENALEYGKKDCPVFVYVSSDARALNISVVNEGNKISDTTMDNLFQPFEKVTGDPDKKALGLGLFIAGKIATAHMGIIVANSNGQTTSFTFEKPMLNYSDN